VKILIVDDHTLVRRGLANLLASCLNDSEITEAGGADEAVDVLKADPPDIALVDVRMPGRDGLELLREIRSSWPQVPVIMLSSYDNGEYVKAALAAGASGYLLKDTTPEDLIQAIHVAKAGSGNVLSPRAVRNLFDAGNEAEEPPRHDTAFVEAGLTKREADVLELLAGGSSNREISRQLYLSEKTVKAHLAAVFRKLGVSNRTQAAMIAVSMGMGTPPTLGGLRAAGGFSGNGSGLRGA